MNLVSSANHIQWYKAAYLFHVHKVREECTESEFIVKRSYDDADRSVRIQSQQSRADLWFTHHARTA